MKVLAWTNPSGSAYWRIIDPFKYMSRKGIDARVTKNAIVPGEIDDFDVFVLQSVVDKQGIAYLYYLQQEKGKKIVCDCDDLLEIDESNPHYVEHQASDAHFTIEQTLRIADMVTVTTPYLAAQIGKLNNNVKILPNYMDMERWDGKILTNTSKEIRIGWVGSMTHLEDIKLVEKPLKQIMDKYPNVKLILVGDLRFKELFEGYNVEVRLGVPFDIYPNLLRGLRLDIGIAPLRDTHFNRAKSNIKTLEYSLCGIPCLASQVAPYIDSLAFTTCSTDKDWYDNLDWLVKDSGLRRRLGRTANEDLKKKYSLDRHIRLWVDAYKSLE